MANIHLKGRDFFDLHEWEAQGHPVRFLKKRTFWGGEGSALHSLDLGMWLC